MEGLSTLLLRYEQIQKAIGQVILGKTNEVRLLLVALLSGGHVLIEDLPGTGKTMLAKSLARCLGCSFQRIQFTPDLMPSDVTGYTYYDQKEQTFRLRQGPIMNNIVLADEINRAIPRTQSSLLESMGEGQLTIDGVTRQIPKPFLVIATQNPIEQEGTFPLPEAQLDRFLICISLGYPTRDEEERILLAHGEVNPLEEIQALLLPEEIEAFKRICKSVFVAESVRGYLVDICRATRNHGSVAVGVSPRATLNLYFACRVLAALDGRGYVLPDDIKHLAQPVLSHRIILHPQERIRGLTSAEVVREIVAAMETPEIRRGEAYG